MDAAVTSLGFEHHDHARCVQSALAKADAHCAAAGLRLTPVRRRALEILLKNHRSMGAYDVLAVLADEGLGNQPPVAYRALDFLVKAGFAHKIEALNAYVACTHPEGAHTPAFLICTDCDSVVETDTAVQEERLGHAARAAGFQIERTVIEAQGVCPACQDKRP